MVDGSHSATPRSVIIVGSGLSGLRTAEKLRVRGYRGRLVVVGKETESPYDRPPLSKNFLATMDAPVPYLRSSDELRALDVAWMLGREATGLDSTKNRLWLGTDSLDFDALVIATGVTPRRLEGIGGSVLRTIQDAHHLRNKLRPGTSVAIIGAGLIGCELAASSRQLGLDVSLIDPLPEPLARSVGSMVGGEIARLHSEQGVKLHLSQSVAEHSADQLILSSGEKIRADVVVQAVGASPDLTWLNESGVDSRNGVDCDNSGRTTRPSVYAVGDVASWANHRSEHWNSAIDQADRVAAAIMDDVPPDPTVSYWWSDQYDTKIQCVGEPAPEDDVKLIRWGPQNRLVGVYSRSDAVTAVVGFSAAPAVMGSRADILARRHVRDVVGRLTA